jgi:hypothetical protein
LNPSIANAPGLKENGTMTAPETPPPKWQNDLPFPRRWLVYVALKIIVVVLAVILVLRYKGLM